MWDAWPSNATWKSCHGRNGLKRESRPETATRSCNLSAAVRNLSPGFRLLPAGAPFCVFSSLGRREKFLKCAAGMARARLREYQRFQACELLLDCWKAYEFSLR